MIPIFEYVFENPKTNNDYNNAFKKIHYHLNHYGKYPMAIKLSSLKSPLEIVQLCELYSSTNNTLYIDAENININYSNIIDECWRRDIYISKTYQMYKKNEIYELENDLKKQSDNPYIWYKIVRGAYWNQDKNTGKLFTNKSDTDKQYDDAIDLTKNVYNTLYATHNINSLEKISKGKNVAQLLGMSDCVSKKMSKTHNVYKYVPFGNFYESIPYLSRRLYENISILQHL